MQGGSIYVKFTSPVDWEGVSDEQSYTVSTTTDNITFDDDIDSCSFIPLTTTDCQVIANIGSTVPPADNYSFSITQGAGTDVPVSNSSLIFNVESAVNSVAYIVDESEPGDVSKCDIVDTGNLEECSNEGVTYGDATTLVNPIGIAIQEIAGENYAYIVNSTSSNVVKCAINEQNNLENCTAYDEVLFDGGDLQGVALREVSNGTNYIYVANSEEIGDFDDGAIIKCEIGDEGAIDAETCTGIGDGGIDVPVGIAFREFNGQVFAYITVDADILKCNTDAGGGIQHECNTSATDDPIGGEPKGIVFQLVGATTYAYVADAGANVVYKCEADNVGDLSECVDALSPEENPFGDPNWIATEEINNKIYVYVTDQGDSMADPAIQSAVIKCEVSESGYLSNCEATVNDIESPAGIAIIDLSE